MSSTAWQNADVKHPGAATTADTITPVAWAHPDIKNPSMSSPDTKNPDAWAEPQISRGPLLQLYNNDGIPFMDNGGRILETIPATSPEFTEASWSPINV